MWEESSKPPILLLPQWKKHHPLLSLHLCPRSQQIAPSSGSKHPLSAGSLPTGFKYVGNYSSPWKISRQCFLSSLTLLSHFPHTLQPLFFHLVVNYSDYIPSSFLFAQFSKHLPSHLTLPFVTIPSSFKCPFLWYLWFYILLFLIPLFLTTSVFLWIHFLCLSLKCQGMSKLKSRPFSLYFLHVLPRGD